MIFRTKELSESVNPKIVKSGLTLSFEISINLSDKSKINDSELDSLKNEIAKKINMILINTLLNIL